MTGQNDHKDTAFTAMTLDILNKVLTSADNPANLGLYLTEEIRELTGARCVLFIQYSASKKERIHRIISVNPVRRTEWAESEEVHDFFKIVHRFSVSKLWRASETSEGVEFLQKEGFDLSLTIPLNIGNLQVGAIILFGMPDETHVYSVMSMLNQLSTIVALVLNNAFIFEKQEQLIKERTDELQAANMSLKESEEKYRRIVETANEGIWMIDKECNTSFVNNRMAEMLGYSKEEMIGKSLFDFMDEEGKIIAEENVERRKLGIKEDHDFKFLRKDGTYIWTSLKTSPFFNDSNIYNGALAMVTDISDSRIAEHGLMETTSKLQALVHEIPDMVIFKDPDCRHIIVNKAVEEFTGISADEIVGKLNEEILPPDVARTCREGDEEAMRRTGPTRYEERSVRSDGKIIYLDTIKAPIHDDQNNLMGLVMISRDITERKLANDEIRSLNEELDQRVKERTKQLEATNKEIQSFSYSVSHDLRAPLRSIDGFTRALAEDYFDRIDDTGKEYINRVRQSVKKMSDLIDAMLNLSRLTREQIKYEVVDLSSIAKKISNNLRSEEPQRQVEFIIQENIKVNGDLKMLIVVLDNLLNNAWKFTSKHAAAKIEFGEKVVNGKRTYFVRDDGAGFDPIYAEKLFTAFQRLHTEVEFPGIGIGLATVQRIINRHRGEVWAEGTVEKGATFYFTIGEENKRS